MKPRPTDEEIARDYELWVKYVHDEIPDALRSLRITATELNSFILPNL